jgi:ribosomal-protein-alanine N-acetyltransferase
MLAMAMQLLPLEREALDNVAAGKDGHGWTASPSVQAVLRDMAVHTAALYDRVCPKAPWISYLMVEAGEAVGTAAFKGNPAADGSVEIAYFTFPPYEGQGHATEAARQLIALAFRDPAIRHVIAHTLPESNASTRVLTKVGMTNVGEVIDPEDGKVWRWSIAR